MKIRTKRSPLALLCAVALVLSTAMAPARAAVPEPDFVFFPRLMPPPGPLNVEGPCGLAVAGNGDVFESNYYHHDIHVFPSSFTNFRTPLSNVDPLDGPCGLGLDSFGRLYVNNYHRNVERYHPSGSGFLAPTVIDSSHPTGVAVHPGPDTVYVNARTHIAAYDSSGAPILDGEGKPLRIGEGSLGDGYGIAVSSFAATAGHVYAPDWADNTVKVYDPSVNVDDPVLTITGPPGGFGSLRDSAVAVDRVTGDIYVADTLAYPQLTERPQAVIQVFDHTGAHKGRLKYDIVDGSPPGLAVDNSGGPTQGRVYVTSGNTVDASIYAYPPGSATAQSGPAAFSLTVSATGTGSGSIASKPAGISCDAVCEEQVRAGSKIPLVAKPGQGSVFAGWSGGGCEGTGVCTVAMSEARSVGARFTAVAESPVRLVAGSPDSLRASASVLTQKGKLRLAVSATLAPRRLPRQGTAPISVSIGGKISSTDGSLPPQLKAMRIEINRHGHLDPTGLPTCPYQRIQPGSSSRALKACRSALVGTGGFTADITLAGQEAYPAKGRLLLFNGRKGGKRVIFGHIYSARPFSTSFVIVFAIQPLGRGTYGTALSAPLPAAMEAWGRLTSLRMTISRRYSHRGERRSYLSSGCPAPQGFPGAIFPLARASFTFAQGKRITSVLTSTCKVRGRG